jgi:hypothetical protein
MKINFFDKKCQSQTHRHKFGICDPPSSSENPAYLDTENPSDWIAIVENSQEIEVTFTAIDKCIEIRKVDGSGGMDTRCEGMLTYANCLIFGFFGLCYAMDGGYKGCNPYIERHLAIFVNYF